MSKSPLVKIGVPSEQASSMRRLRRVRTILEQHDAAIGRLEAATHERIREAMNEDGIAADTGGSTPPADSEQSAVAH
jgi:hypothetical protein